MSNANTVPLSITSSDPALFLRMTAVTRLTGLGRSTIYRLVAQDKCPSPVRLGVAQSHGYSCQATGRLPPYEGRGWQGFHHHATLAIAAYAFLMAQHLRYPGNADKKIPPTARNLPYPRITSLAAAQRTQRHVPSSITSLRLRIAAALLMTLPRCPCCL